MQLDEAQPMPEGWVSHPNSQDKFSRSLVVDHQPRDKMSRYAVAFSAKLRNDGAGWRWNIWYSVGSDRKHLASGWKIYRLEAAEEADAALAGLAARYHLGAL